MGHYTLPGLRYDYGALEPHYGAKLLEPHHAVLHANYVEQANGALEMLAELREQGDRGAAYFGAQHQLAFAASGHILHSLFWTSMAPGAGGEPPDELATAICESFGTVERCRRHLEAATTQARGSGWGALVWEPIAGELMVMSIHDHESNLIPSAVPLMVIDGWEHAFAVQYGTDKDAYLEGFWNVADWQSVAERFEHARRPNLAPTER